MDLGTANTVVFQRGTGIVLFEPSVVAVDERSGEVQAVGEEARQMIGRTPAHIRATRPLRHGVINDFDTTEKMLRHFIRRVIGRFSVRADVMVCVPSGVTQVERNAVVEATLAAGAAHAYLIEEPLAAAIGADLPVAEPHGALVVDVGGGTSEMAVTALGGMVVANSVRIGGYDLDDAIVRLAHDKYRLHVGQEQAEAAKIAIGSTERNEIAGRDRTTGLLRRVSLSAEDVHHALQRPLSRIVDAVTDLLERTPAELSSDIAADGLTLVGGGALLPALDRLLHDRTGIRVTVDADPLTTVARGAGRALETGTSLRSTRRRSRGTPRAARARSRRGPRRRPGRTAGPTP